MRSEDETQSSRRLLRNGGGAEKPKPRRKGHVPWKLIAVVLVAVVVVAAVIVLKPNEPLVWFRRGTRLTLESTEDNLPIEDLLVYTPFPNQFENLNLFNYGVFTERDGILTFQERLLENTLERSAPVFTVENAAIGKQVVIRMDEMHPGDQVFVNWLFFAPKNTSLYDAPEENRLKVYVNYASTKKIKLKINADLVYENKLRENWSNIVPETLGIYWWRWWKYIEGPGEIDAPSENVQVF